MKALSQNDRDIDLNPRQRRGDAGTRPDRERQIGIRERAATQRVQRADAC
jgi:hypothetical protein